jgi:hypothetical protein
MDGKQLAMCALLTMVVPAGAEREIADVNGSVHRAFIGLMYTGGYRMRWIEGAGMVVGKVR